MKERGRARGGEREKWEGKEAVEGGKVLRARYREVLSIFAKVTEAANSVLSQRTHQSADTRAGAYMETHSETWEMSIAPRRTPVSSPMPSFHVSTENPLSKESFENNVSSDRRSVDAPACSANHFPPLAGSRNW